MFNVSYRLSLQHLRRNPIGRDYFSDSASFVFLFGFFVMTTNFQYKDFTLLQPILENGITPVVKGMIYPGRLCRIPLYSLFSTFSPSKIKWYHLYFIAIVLILLTLSPTIGAIIEFGPVVSSLQRYPAFEQWRIVSIGKYIEHMDFLSIYQWFVGTFIRLSMMGILICRPSSDAIQKSKNNR